MTAIQWTDETWNPTTGCTKVSRGCRNCYIVTTMPFRMEGRAFVRGATDIRLHPDRLDKPLRWRKSRRIFVNSLSDLFHEDIDYHFVREVFNTMRRCDGGIVAATGKANPSHTFQVLTKRPERALELWRDRKLGFETWPPNVWLGVSIEDSRVTWRADVLREIPAAVRFISAEPLLGSLYDGRRDVSAPDLRARGRLELEAQPAQVDDLDQGDVGLLRDREDPRQRVRVRDDVVRLGGAEGLDAAGGVRGREVQARADAPRDHQSVGRAPLDLSGIDWVIIGGESGGKARPFHLEHAREIIVDSRVQGFLRRYSYAGLEFGLSGPAVFVKQLGAKPMEKSVAILKEIGGGTEYALKLRDRKGGDMAEWPADLRIREFPRAAVPA